MAIETLDDLNQILGQCCCEMPECPVPTKECETRSTSLSQDYGSEGESDPTPPDGTVYGSWTQFECVSGDAGDDIPYLYRKSVYTEGDIPSQPEDTYTCAALSARRDTNFERYGEYVISDPISYAGLYAAALLALESESWANGACLSSNDKNWPKIGDVDCTRTCEQLFFEHRGISDTRVDFGSVDLVQHRFRWVIPDTWTGSYFKTTWDVVFFPETGDPSAVLTDQTWEWTGPGDPEDAATWKSGWYEIAPPESAGEVRVVNVRFECYRPAAFGIKPQVAGEAVTLA